MMLAVAAVTLAPVLGGMALRAALGYPANTWWTGFSLGVVAGCLPCLLWMAVTQIDGSASWRLGALAEEWTAERLKVLPGSWHIEHSVPFPAGRSAVDVDHILVGYGGVLAIETKWTSHAIELGAKHLHADVQRAVQQAIGNANRVRGLIQRVAPGTNVTPVVVFWGPQVTSLATLMRKERSALIVAGRDADDWVPLLGSDNLEPEATARIVERLQWWRQQQDTSAARAQTRRPLARTKRAA